ncbi:MAG: hypothetical protein KKA81_05715 [Bacteroidetes bacterium]|nr:hypothetical protein [Bacteroidota bacterium]
MKVLRYILSILAGLVLGSIVNMAIVMLSGHIIPLPEGVDMTNLQEGIRLFEPKHFIMPFLAHALGTLVGAFIATLISKDHRLLMAMIVGLLFLAGGIINVLQLNAPLWFNALDLIAAYLPMAWAGYGIAAKI